MNRLSPNIQKLSALSSQNRYLDGAAATQSSHVKKRTSSTNAHSADLMTRLQNWVTYSNYIIQLKPSWTF
jgi:hypothetical protein